MAVGGLAHGNFHELQGLIPQALSKGRYPSLHKIPFLLADKVISGEMSSEILTPLR